MTTTPWRITTLGDKITDRSGCDVVRLRMTDVADRFISVSLKDAELIVRCVNSHESLVAALKSMITIGSYATSGHDKGCGCATCLLTAKARAALQQAEG